MIKKFFALAAIFAATMMSFTACEEDKPVGPGLEDETPADVCPDCQKNPCECEPEAAITIDGEFADWDNLEGVQVATLPKGDVDYEQLKTFKLFADETFIYVFCEFDPENTLVFVPYFDLDNDPTTGNDSKWSGAGYEAKAEGSVFEEEGDGVQGAPKAWDPAFYMYTDSGTEEVCAAGLGAVMSSVPAPYNGGATYAFEAAIVREMIAGQYNLGDQFTMGMIQYDLSWSYIGKLPCKTLDQKDAGELEPMLTITLP